MLPNEDLHDKIMNAFNEYFKAHQRWVTIQNSSTGVDLRKELMAMRKLSVELRKYCDDQRTVVQDWRYYHFSAKNPSKRAKALIAERDQKIKDGTADPITKIKIKHRH